MEVSKNTKNSAINGLKISQVSQSNNPLIATPNDDATSTSSFFLHFEVEDTGPGIATEELTIIFEPFVQTKTGKDSQEGTGLGLPISRKFVELMGGEMTVSSAGRVRALILNLTFKSCVVDTAKLKAQKRRAGSNCARTQPTPLSDFDCRRQTEQPSTVN